LVSGILFGGGSWGLYIQPDSATAQIAPRLNTFAANHMTSSQQTNGRELGAPEGRGKSATGFRQ